MAEYSDREAFIPFSRYELLQRCLQDAHFQEYAPQFSSFAELLNAYLHFVYHQKLEILKKNFAHRDPDRDTLLLEELSENEAKTREAELAKVFDAVLERANFQQLTRAQLQEALNESSMISLEMEIDFDDFEHLQMYWRGIKQEAMSPQNFWQRLQQKWGKPPKMLDVYQRVVMLIQYKPQEYFMAKGLNPEEMRFEPGKFYLYLYKMIPKQDLEVLFPNVRISMTWKDRLLFILPALGAAVPMTLKALPQLLLIAGVLLFFTMGPGTAQRMGVGHEQVQNFLPVLVALLSLGVVFGGFAVKQYLNYKNKRLKFLKDVTDTLFFRNLVCNAGVFHALIDAAEEEEAKEVLLVFFFLLQQKQALSSAEIDDGIEAWLEQQGAKVDFDIHKTLNTLQSIQNKSKALVSQDSGGKYLALSLTESCEVLDEIWDHLFRYHDASVSLG